MNWIATAFEALKAKVESHIPHVDQSLTELASRVSGVETYTQSAVDSLDSRIKALEQLAAGKAPGQ
jgi:hypothetical protein